MAEKEKDPTLVQLKEKLQKKLKDVEKDLKTLNSKLIKNLSEQNGKIKEQYTKHINNLKDMSISFVRNKEKKIKEKEIISNVYYEAIRNIKRTEKFEKNLSEIIIDSIKYYNNFISNNLPFYKNLSHQYLMNYEDKLCNNNIYSKITNKQMNIIYSELKNINIKCIINGKYPIDSHIIITDNYIDNSLPLSSTTNKINSFEIEQINDNYFEDFFNNVREEKKKKLNTIIFKNCELKTSEIIKIPLIFNNLKIIDSKINSSIFNNMSFKNIIKLNLDNSQIDSFNFDNILKNILKIENKNLKEFSAKNNYITRIILKDKLDSEKNKLISLEIFNLSNNYIYVIDRNILDYIPNIKIFDLSNNNLLHQINCKELINNCKGIILLLRNLVILKDNMYNYYLDYYQNILSNNINNKFPLEYINFDSLFYKRNNINILKFDYTNTKNIENISELNLSSCSLDNKTVKEILLNCISIKNNIAKINLSYNLLNEEIFDLLIEDKINALLKNLKELDLSYNSIQFKINLNENYKSNQFVLFLDNYSQLELLNLKTTPFEEKINYFIKSQVNEYYEKKGKQHDKEKKKQDDKDFKEIKNIIDNYCLQINHKFHIIINDIVTSKYTAAKRMKSILPILDKNLIIDNLKIEIKDTNK